MLYFTDDDKLLAMDDRFETHFKFDLVFSDNDFSCQVLSRGRRPAGPAEIQHFLDQCEGHTGIHGLCPESVGGWS